ncbi:hypothetical protein ACNR9V_03105 [Parageobacillus thermoglucosidasius]|uniref:hypothetical protein n=1 Tax=Parageobacillus thermoglucosidasius TaxID=1426 RepID=UPI003B6835C5
MAKCKGCGAEIVWIKTPNGKAMPCDPEKKVLVSDEGEIVSGRVPHWATCPAANKFKKQ